MNLESLTRDSDLPLNATFSNLLTRSQTRSFALLGEEIRAASGIFTRTLCFPQTQPGLFAEQPKLSPSTLPSLSEASLSLSPSSDATAIFILFFLLSEFFSIFPALTRESPTAAAMIPNRKRPVTFASGSNGNFGI